MRDDRRLYVVCYDICHPKRLRKVYKICRAFGDHIQFSVFRCVLNRQRLVELRSALEDVVAPGKDQILLFPIGLADNQDTWDCICIGLPLESPERVVRIFG